MEKSVIRARGLTKKYGEFVAVDRIDFAIQGGECFGFLGPNGAGKTSTMKMLTCISPVSEGELVVDGRDVRSEQKAIKSVLGVVSQADSLDPDLTVFQNLVSYGRYFNLPGDVGRQRAIDALKLFQLAERSEQKPDELSGGMRRRLLIARALLHDPSILVLDEPTTGLDPQSRRSLWSLLRQYKTDGAFVLLTTQSMEEAEALCDRVGIIQEGRLLALDRVEKLRADHGLEFKVTYVPNGATGERLTLYGSDDQELVEKVREMGVDQFSVAHTSLEDVYFALTGGTEGFNDGTA